MIYNNKLDNILLVIRLIKIIKIYEKVDWRICISLYKSS